MNPRIVHIPLSGGDRKAQAKGIRQAHGLHQSYYQESVLIRSAAAVKIREADRLECDAWNAIMWAGGPAMPSPSKPQAEPTIGKAINGASIFWKPAALVQSGLAGRPPCAETAPETPVLEAGSGALLRALQRGPAL